MYQVCGHAAEDSNNKHPELLLCICIAQVLTNCVIYTLEAKTKAHAAVILLIGCELLHMQADDP